MGSALIMDGFANVNGWTFYKIKTKGTMTNFNVEKTCSQNNLITPCYTGTFETFNTDECQVVFPKSVTEDADTMQYLSIQICGHRKPEECQYLVDTFVYKANWVGESACGSMGVNIVLTESSRRIYGPYALLMLIITS